MSQHGDSNTASQLLSLPGPIAVIGAAGFVGANLSHRLQQVRSDVVGITRAQSDLWRLTALGVSSIEVPKDHNRLIDQLKALEVQTVFNLAAHGAYSSQSNSSRILETNLDLVFSLSRWAADSGVRLVQAGSSSEYGRQSAGPREGITIPQPNSEYAISKLGASLWLEHMAQTTDLASVTLRLYSVFGPLEDPGRLVPTLIREGMRGSLPPLANPDVSRDFVFIDDVIGAFIAAAHYAKDQARGLSINIGTGHETTMREAAEIARREFAIQEEPVFGDFARPWDLDAWYADPSLASRVLSWEAKTSFAEGLTLTREFYESEGNTELLTRTDEGPSLTNGHKRSLVSVVVACYRDGQAIPYMYERVKNSLGETECDFELILVNDASPDDTLPVIEALSAADPRVIGITHSRNFGSQAAFLSGMRLAHGDYVALLDGDLQDPPELLPVMLDQLQQGFDVAYGRRVSREAPRLMQFAYKGFYRVFSRFSPFEVPRDAGDFSLMTRRVAMAIQDMPERDLFIRAQRAYVGFRQVGVDYVRPERMFGKSTNSLRRNVGWAMRGLLSVSRAPLTALSIFGAGIFGLAAFLILLQIITRIFWPGLAPEGLATISILILGMGALNILAISIVGEYVGRILDESKRRPRYVRRLVTLAGVTEDAHEGDQRI